MYAHTLIGKPESCWEPLPDHLGLTASYAARHAGAFGSDAWGRLAGLWHDLGKYRPEFQARLRGSREQVEHAGVGAALAASKGSLGTAVAFAIAGHHAGLANHIAQADTAISPLRERLERNAPELERLRALAPAELLDLEIPIPPSFLLPGSAPGRTQRELTARRIEFWTRFLFSALVDADRLATEAFYDPTRRSSAQSFDGIPQLEGRLTEWLGRFQIDSPVNRVRAEVLEASHAAAELPPGLFSLTVPTGGGKTLSSMAFALRHAVNQDLRRVIVVIPYTSIIEQNARVYREALGSHNVIEHHSTIDEAARLETGREDEIRRRLASENWDAPVVVTTNVQFYESLFSNHPSRCRKLHNIARSVILLDEAQSIPADYLNALLDALRELAGPYGCSIVLMTATQPALQRRDSLPFGLEGVREIIPEPARLAGEIDRVKTWWPGADAPPTEYADLSLALRAHEQVLAIVHLRRDARELASQLPPAHRYHLSALMCPAHRTEILAEVKAHLDRGLPCRLVATQLIEAGVDIDFPVVYRALAGLDSLAQAAGRCNREGQLRDEDGVPRKGEFHVFRAPTRPPPGILKLGLETTDSLLRSCGDDLSLSDAALLEEYFRMLYGKCETDRKGVQTERAQLNFATVAERVRLIEDDYTRPVVVPWADSDARVAAFRVRPDRLTQRALQPYLVQIPERELRKLDLIGALQCVHETVHVLDRAYAHLYDRDFGLMVDADAMPDPAAYIVG